MAMEVENRVTKLEQVLERFIVNTEKSISSLTEDRKKDRKENKAFYEKENERNRIALENYTKENKIEFQKYKEQNRIEFQKYKEENRVEFQKYKEENRVEFQKYKEQNSVEFQKYKEEYRVEFQKYKEENRVALETLKELSKNEMKEFKQEMNKTWGDLANKMGTVIEDIIIPGISPTLKKYFGARLNFIGTRIKKNIKELGLKGEFDIVATDEARVYVTDVKSSPDKVKIDEFKNKLIPRFRKLFPEFDSKTLIPIMGSVRFDEDIISYASKEGIYVMGYREWEYLDILNFDEVKSK